MIPHLWSISGAAGFVVSSMLPSVVARLSFHMPTGKLGSRPPHPLWGPRSEAPRFGVALLRRHRLGAKGLSERGGLRSDAGTCGHCSGCTLHPCGTADPVVDEGQALVERFVSP